MMVDGRMAAAFSELRHVVMCWLSCSAPPLFVRAGSISGQSSIGLAGVGTCNAWRTHFESPRLKQVVRFELTGVDD